MVCDGMKEEGWIELTENYKNGKQVVITWRPIKEITVCQPEHKKTKTIHNKPGQQTNGNKKNSKRLEEQQETE